MSKPTNKIVTCHDIEGKTYEVSVANLSFRPAVYAAIIKDNKILLSKQWDGYDFPGGGINLGEEIKVALIRETKEETGLDVEPTKLIHASESFFKLPFVGDYVHSIHLFYLCDVLGGEISTAFLDEHEKQYAVEAEWIDLEKLPTLKMCSSAKPTEVLAGLKGS